MRGFSAEDTETRRTSFRHKARQRNVNGSAMAAAADRGTGPIVVERSYDATRARAPSLDLPHREATGMASQSNRRFSLWLIRYETTVDVDALASDVAGCGRGQEYHHGGDVFWLVGALQRHA